MTLIFYLTQNHKIWDRLFNFYEKVDFEEKYLKKLFFFYFYNKINLFVSEIYYLFFKN